MPTTPAAVWLERLTEEDAAFVKRFLLASGSLKAVAEEYGISYPTVRLRLDRLIEKIKLFDSQQITSDFERKLRSLYVDGKIDFPSMTHLLEAFRHELTKKEDSK